jgi:hypothetical protein
METLFYGVTIAFLFLIFRSDSISLLDLCSYLFPVYGNHYWFIAVYIGLMCLNPFLSLAVNQLNQIQYKCLLLVLIVFGCTISHGFPFGVLVGVSNGLSLFWFVILFIWSGYLRRFPLKISSKLAFYLYWAIVLFSFLFIIIKAPFFQRTHFIEFPASNSFGFFIALFMFIWFNKKKELKGIWAKKVSSCVPYLFSVYLISEHPFMRHLIWNDLFDWTLLRSNGWFILVMLTVVVIVFFFSIIIDYGRTILFKALHVDVLADWVCKKVSILINRITGEVSL